MNDERTIKLEVAIREILLTLGINPEKDENFKDTPQRVARMYLEVFSGEGNGDRVKEILSTVFPTAYSGILTHNNILAFSFCPHHILPVEYNVSLGYISHRTVGLSKIPRVVELLAKRPVLQETFTHEIADVIEEHLEAKGVVVIVRGRHSCMRIRGVRTLTDVVVTSEVKGIFKEDFAARAEVMRLLDEGNQK